MELYKAQSIMDLLPVATDFAAWERNVLSASVSLKALAPKAGTVGDLNK